MTATEAPRIGLDAELVDEVPVPVQIVADVWEPGRKGQQWHLALKPLSFLLQGKTGMYHEWYGISMHKQSKMGIAIATFKKVFGATNPETGVAYQLGEHEFEGQNVWFARRTVKLPGRDRETGEPISFQVWIPLRQMTDQEIEQAEQELAANIAAQQSGASGNGQLQGGAVGTSGADAPAPATLSDEDLQLLAVYYDGKTDKETKIRAANPKSGLSKTAINAVMSGKAGGILLDRGLVTLSGDKYARTAPEAAPEAAPEDAPAEAAETA